MHAAGDIDAPRASEMIYWQNRIADVLEAAKQRGVVITVSNPPNDPPMMGNYDLVVSARPLRNYKR
jgi:hypothetical protein